MFKIKKIYIKQKDFMETKVFLTTCLFNQINKRKTLFFFKKKLKEN